MRTKLLLIPVLLLLLAPGGLRAQAGSSIPVKIYISSHDDVYKFRALGVGIEELRNGYIEARVSEAKAKELQDLGWKVEKMMPVPEEEKIVTAYHNYSWLTAKLDSVHANYPNITRLISIGTSVQGRELWAMLVSDHPDSNENEAEVRFTSTIHGDEPVGTELCLGLIDSLTQGYGSVAAMQELVNSREIWFLPMFNPDGNTANSRFNANGKDLNRNYPVPDGSIGDDGTYTIELENQHMINWVASRRFVLGCMYHGGATVVNYQWDYLSDPSPDNDMIREVSLGYARLNDPLYNTLWPNYPDPYTVSDSGVVFGYYWYPVNGSLQDWSYHANSFIDITIELNDVKKPAASQLPGLWTDNRNSMLFFIRQAGLGIQGLVTDSATGLPLDFARVEAAGIDKPVYTDSIGDYHRMLLSGTYDLTFSKEGYFPKTFSGVRVRYDSLTNLDVALVRDPAGVTGNPCEIVCQRVRLLKTYPNPLRSSITVSFHLSEQAGCKLKIFNAAGQLVRTIIDRPMGPGTYDILWDGADEAGRKTADGVYYFSLAAGEQRLLAKLVKIN